MASMINNFFVLVDWSWDMFFKPQQKRFNTKESALVNTTVAVLM